MVVDLGAAETVMPRSMFPEIGIRQTERMSVRTPEGFARKSTWQVADVRRPLLSASHIIQAGNYLFIGKDEAYIMNRKKKEKSVLKKGRERVCARFVREGTIQRGSAHREHAHGG